MFVGADHSRHQRSEHRHARRTYLVRGDLLPNPCVSTPWQALTLKCTVVAQSMKLLHGEEHARHMDKIMSGTHQTIVADIEISLERRSETGRGYVRRAAYVSRRLLGTQGLERISRISNAAGSPSHPVSSMTMILYAHKISSAPLVIPSISMSVSKQKFICSCL
jgi:hypothetical protein